MLVVKYIEPWAMGHQQRWASEALQTFGEKVLFRHRWNIADFAAGRVGRCTKCSGSNFVAEQQKIIVGNATGGTFTLTFDGETTAPIAFNANIDDLETALKALSTVPDTISVSGISINRGFTIEFPVVETEVPLITATASLVPNTTQVKINRVQKGSVDVRSRITEVYKQAGDSWCEACYGVGFEGGFEPTLYVTWALIQDQEQETTRSKSGTIQRETPLAQFSFEPEVQEFDMIVRVVEWADKVTPAVIHGRSILRKVAPLTLRTGPGTPERGEVVYDPPEWRRPLPDEKFESKDQRWMVGQTAEIVNLPLEHPWNRVPITKENVKVALVGTDAKHEWWNRLNAAAGLNPELSN